MRKCHWLSGSADGAGDGAGVGAACCAPARAARPTLRNIAKPAIVRGRREKCNVPSPGGCNSRHILAVTVEMAYPDSAENAVRASRCAFRIRAPASGCDMLASPAFERSSIPMTQAKRAIAAFSALLVCTSLATTSVRSQMMSAADAMKRIDTECSAIQNAVMALKPVHVTLRSGTWYVLSDAQMTAALQTKASLTFADVWKQGAIMPGCTRTDLMRAAHSAQRSSASARATGHSRACDRRAPSRPSRGFRTASLLHEQREVDRENVLLLGERPDDRKVDPGAALLLGAPEVGRTSAATAASGSRRPTGTPARSDCNWRT